MRWYLPIAGTRPPWRGRHDRRDWYHRGSPFDAVMVRHGYQRVDQDRDSATPDRGFWSGHVNGVLLQTLWRRHGKHRAWRQGSTALLLFLMRRHAEVSDGLTIVAHSHGGQVLAYDLARDPDGPPVHVVSVDMPVRRDMGDVYRRALARSNVRSWTHLYSERGWASRFRWLGNRFGPRELDGATRNLEITGGHSGILRDPAQMGQWDAILARREGDPA